MKIIPLFAALVCAALPIVVLAETVPATAPARVAVVVDIATPAGISDDKIRTVMAQQATQYAQVPGLIRKYFTIRPGHFGGIYYWSSKAAAEAWFNDSWHARVKATYGTPGEVTYYDVPVAVDGVKP